MSEGVNWVAYGGGPHRARKHSRQQQDDSMTFIGGVISYVKLILELHRITKCVVEC